MKPIYGPHKNPWATDRVFKQMAKMRFEKFLHVLTMLSVCFWNQREGKSQSCSGPDGNLECCPAQLLVTVYSLRNNSGVTKQTPPTKQMSGDQPCEWAAETWRGPGEVLPPTPGTLHIYWPGCHVYPKKTSCRQTLLCSHLCPQPHPSHRCWFQRLRLGTEAIHDFHREQWVHLGISRWEDWTKLTTMGRATGSVIKLGRNIRQGTTVHVGKISKTHGHKAGYRWALPAQLL